MLYIWGELCIWASIQQERVAYDRSKRKNKEFIDVVENDSDGMIAKDDKIKKYGFFLNAPINSYANTINRIKGCYQ